MEKMQEECSFKGVSFAYFYKNQEGEADFARAVVGRGCCSSSWRLFLCKESRQG